MKNRTGEGTGGTWWSATKQCPSAPGLVPLQNADSGDVASSWGWGVQRVFPNLNYDSFSKLPLWLLPEGCSWGVTLWSSPGESWLSLWAFCVWHWGWMGLCVSLSAGSLSQGSPRFPVPWRAALGHCQSNTLLRARNCISSGRGEQRLDPS